MKTEQTFMSDLMSHIREVYQEEAKEIVDKHKNQVEQELHNLMDEIVTRAGLRIEELVKLESFGSEIRITILKDNRNSQR